jgi:hypothetical protein
MEEQSQDQPLIEESQDQAQPEESGNDSETLIEVNGEELTLDELKKGYMRTADYTRKTQKLAQDKSKSLEDIQESNPELYQAVVQLREAGVATKDDIAIAVEETLERIEAKKSGEISDKQFFADNPDLESSKKAILDLSKSTGLTPEEVAIQYNFMDKDRKRSRDVKGKFAPKEKSYSELSRQEKDAFLNSQSNLPDNVFYRK